MKELGITEEQAEEALKKLRGGLTFSERLSKDRDQNGASLLLYLVRVHGAPELVLPYLRKVGVRAEVALIATVVDLEVPLPLAEPDD